MSQSKEEVLVLTTPTSLAEVPAGVRSAFIQAIGGDVYFWLDGSTPADDGSSGQLLLENESIMLLRGVEIHGFKAIQKNGDTSKLMISYESSPY